MLQSHFHHFKKMYLYRFVYKYKFDYKFKKDLNAFKEVLLAVKFNLIILQISV